MLKPALAVVEIFSVTESFEKVCEILNEEFENA